MKLRIWLLVTLPLVFGCADGDMGGGPLPSPSPSPSPTATPAPTPRPPPMIFPTGVITDDAALSRTRGIYSVPGKGEQCCWLSDSVEFEINSPPGARSVRLTLVQLATPSIRRTPQMVSVVGAKDRVIAIRRVDLGANHLVVPLQQPPTHGGRAVVTLRLRSSFVPSVEHTGADGRRLSLILTDVSSVGATRR